jgi:hypothetical protein
MYRSFFIYLIICVSMFSPIAWEMEVPFDPEMENQLKASYSIVLVPQIKVSQEERKETKENTPLKISLNFDHPELYDQGEDGACAFFSTICSMLMVETGKQHLKKMFLGQDDDSVFIKFPTPAPFEITDIDEFLVNFTGKWHHGFDKVQYLKKNVFKVSKDIIVEHTPLSAFPNAPDWFRLLAAAYFKVVQSFDEADGEVFEWLPTSLQVAYFQGESNNTADIDILSGKPLLFKLNLEDVFEKENFPQVSSLIGKPIRNLLSDSHDRALCISENRVCFFDSLEPEKGIFVSNLFNDGVSKKNLEDEMARNISSLLQEVKSIQKKITNMAEENTSEDANNTAEKLETVANEVRETLVEEYEQVLLKIEQALAQRFPFDPSARPLNIQDLSQEEFIIRLYAELAKSNAFKLEVLDL